MKSSTSICALIIASVFIQSASAEPYMFRYKSDVISTSVVAPPDDDDVDPVPDEFISFPDGVIVAADTATFIDLIKSYSSTWDIMHSVVSDTCGVRWLNELDGGVEIFPEGFSDGDTCTVVVENSNGLRATLNATIGTPPPPPAQPYLDWNYTYTDIQYDDEWRQFIQIDLVGDSRTFNQQNPLQSIAVLTEDPMSDQCSAGPDAYIPGAPGIIDSVNVGPRESYRDDGGNEFGQYHIYFTGNEPVANEHDGERFWLEVEYCGRSLATEILLAVETGEGEANVDTFNYGINLELIENGGEQAFPLLNPEILGGVDDYWVNWGYCWGKEFSSDGTLLVTPWNQYDYGSTCNVVINIQMGDDIIEQEVIFRIVRSEEQQPPYLEAWSVYPARNGGLLLDNLNDSRGRLINDIWNEYEIIVETEWLPNNSCGMQRPTFTLVGAPDYIEYAEITNPLYDPRDTGISRDRNGRPYSRWDVRLRGHTSLPMILSDVDFEIVVENCGDDELRIPVHLRR